MTRDGNGGWVRTEDDLRQALATLERHAPSADTVLAALRGAARVVGKQLSDLRVVIAGAGASVDGSRCAPRDFRIT